MATLTKEQLRDRILEHLGVKPAGQSARAEDASLVDEAVDAAHARLSKLGLAPFAASAIPDWAQQPLRDYVAGDVGRSFGFGDTLAPQKAQAEKDLGRQCSGYRHPIPIVTRYY